MLIASLLMFCRTSLALLFFVSAGSKSLALRDFAVTIDNFKLLPRRWNKPVAWLFLSGEIATVVLIMVGKSLLYIGFLLAMVLLAIFAIALVSALARNIDTSCNCFGKSERRISPYDVTRNVLFILCALSGLWLLQYPPQNLEMGEITLITCMAAVVIVLVANLKDIIETLLQPLSLNTR